MLTRRHFWRHPGRIGRLCRRRPWSRPGQECARTSAPRRCRTRGFPHEDGRRRDHLARRRHRPSPAGRGVREERTPGRGEGAAGFAGPATGYIEHFPSRPSWWCRQAPHPHGHRPRRVRRRHHRQAAENCAPPVSSQRYRHRCSSRNYHGDHIGGLANRAGDFVFSRAKSWCRPGARLLDDDAKIGRRTRRHEERLQQCASVFAQMPANAGALRSGSEVVPASLGGRLRAHAGHTLFEVNSGGQMFAYVATSPTCRRCLRAPDGGELRHGRGGRTQVAPRRLRARPSPANAMLGGFHFPFRPSAAPWPPARIRLPAVD